MLGHLKNILAKVSGGIIEKDLGRLNLAGGRLGDKAVAYVKTGQNGSVLSTLQNTQVQADLLFPFGYNMRDDKIGQSRRAFFLDAEPYDTALMARYAEVLTAASANTTQPRSHNLAGPATANANLRVLFGEAFRGSVGKPHSWPREPRTEPIGGLTPEAAIDIGKELGVSPEEVTAVLLWDGSGWGTEYGESYRQLVDMKSFISGNPELIVKTNKLLDAQSRIALIKILQEHSLCGTEPLLSLVFDFAGASAKSVRNSALNALLTLPMEIVEQRAVSLLESGNATVRQGMVGVLGKLGTESAIYSLKSHLKVEKTARIAASIENALTAIGASDELSDEQAGEDDQSVYTAIDGDRVEIPAKLELSDDQPFQFGRDTLRDIEAIFVAYNDHIREENKELKRKNQRWAMAKPIESPARTAQAILDAFNKGQIEWHGRKRQNPLLIFQSQAPEQFADMLNKVPLRRQIQISSKAGYWNYFQLRAVVGGDSLRSVLELLASENGDLRVIEDVLIADGQTSNLGSWRNRVERPFEKGDLLYEMIPYDDWMTPELDQLPDTFLWPYIADNFAILDEAFGLVPPGKVPTSRLAAIRLLKRLPKTPMRYFGPLLDIATGETKTGRSEARALLSDVPQVDERLVALLSDSRQAIRAGAAEWLGTRGRKDAAKPLKSRLKKEKSELAKAAMLTALAALDEDLSSFVGPTALMREAEAGLKKAKFDKLDWLNLQHLPKLKWRGGKTVPDEVIKWWLFVANKLKQPGGNALFEIYLDQLDKGSAEALSNWIFDSWITFDTKQPDESEGIAYAKANVKQRFAQWSRYFNDLTEEAVFQSLKNEITGQYLNSGAANKGILGLATRVPAARAADQVRQYLRLHGKRTSQASSLLELLAAKGDAVSQQVVIGAATRLKQKGVQAKAGEMIDAVAEARGWTMEELADRTIPTGGLDDNRIVELPCGPDKKPYRAQLGDDLQLIVFNPDGKAIKALPSNDDDNTKESKKQLSTSKREIKQVVKAQSERLYEALCAERCWPVEDWTRDFDDHPVMRRLIERVVWLGLDANGHAMSAFRPTADGEFTDVEDNPVDPADFASIRLAHGTLLHDEQTMAWQQHLDDYEVTPLFHQFGRPLLRLQEDMQKDSEIREREGWVTDAFTIRGAASKLGYERGETLDGGFFCDYVKRFKSANLVAIIQFSGNCLPEENVTAAMKTLHFANGYSGYNDRKVSLKDVPPVLLSECWNDYRDMANKAKFDPDWETKMPW